jgi:hypothetical protein
MGIGIAIVLMAIGLILALAVDAQVSGVDIQMVGWILFAAGALGLLLELIVWGPRRRAAPARGEYVEERRIRDDGPAY